MIVNLTQYSYVTQGTYFHLYIFLVSDVIIYVSLKIQWNFQKYQI